MIVPGQHYINRECIHTTFHSICVQLQQYSSETKVPQLTNGLECHNLIFQKLTRTKLRTEYHKTFVGDKNLYSAGLVPTYKGKTNQIYYVTHI